MKIKCPSCAKNFDVPASTEQRSVRCGCKTIFKVTESCIVSREDTNVLDLEAKTSTEETLDIFKPKGGGYYEEDAAPPEGEFGDETINNFIKGLKESAKQESTPREPAPTPRRVLTPAEIDVDRPAAMIQESIMAQVPQNTPPQASQRGGIQELPRVSNSRPIAPKTFHTRILLVAGAFAIVVVTALSAFLRKAPIQVEEDPYLSKLLTAPSNSIQKSNGTVVHVQKNLDPVKVTDTSVETKTAKITFEAQEKKAEKEELEKAYTRIRSLFIRGRFKDAIQASAQQKSLSTATLALKFESEIHLNMENKARLRALEQEIQTALQKSKHPAPLQRALAWLLMQDQYSTKRFIQGVQILKSLELTSSTDPLVHTYLGFAFFNAGKIKSAHTKWDHALTLEPNLRWLIKYRESLYKKAGDSANMKRMQGLLKVASVDTGQPD